MTRSDLRQLLADIENAIEAYVDEGQNENIGAAARAAIQSLVENGAIDFEDG